MYIVNVNTETCTGCGDCVEVCPVGILEVIDGVVEVEGEDCMGCESCVEACSTDSISVQEL